MIQSTITPKLDIKLEKNSRGFNFEIKLSQADGATTAQIDKAFELLDYAKDLAEKKYGAASISGGAQ